MIDSIRSTPLLAASERSDSSYQRRTSDSSQFLSAQIEGSEMKTALLTRANSVQAATSDGVGCFRREEGRGDVCAEGSAVVSCV